ncbi:MAG: endospore coat-associated protein [Paenibacillus sp.]|jgi:glutathione synthase/RimK-type ligase-like ATP-grasp enzyme|nr:endospore coat-associated protein [Paenibacillus sp.]
MMTPSSRHVLGIMTTQIEGNPPFLNRGFYRRLTLAGSKAGFTVIVFTPQGIDWLAGSVTGYAYDAVNREWLCRLFPLPDAVYDRCFFSTRRQYAEYRTAVRRLREHPSVLFLGYGLKGKWEVQHMLELDGRFKSHLPQTETMRSVRSAADWLKARGQVLLKPQAGSQGRGVLLVQRSSVNAAQRLAVPERWPGEADAAVPGVPSRQATPAMPRQARSAAGAGRDAAQTAGHRHGGTAPAPASALVPVPGGSGGAQAAFTVRGRDARNRHVQRGFADAPALLRWLRRFTAQRSYLLQQYLLLQTYSGDAYDVRSLVQKDGTGRWQVTGMAVRQGQGGSLTSNLHGGGTVQPAEPFLVRQFGADKAKSIAYRLQDLSVQIPEALEKHHGRLAELGIDFGVDTEGHIWILEVNSKPGRSIFTYLHDNQARINALTNPIRYARYLLQRSRPRAMK